MRVYDRLLKHITSPELAPGERLASMPRLAKMFETSVFTIQQAVRELEADGYLDSRHGSGTFIASCHRPLTMADAVTVCMETKGHLWSELSSRLMAALSAQGKIGMLLEINEISGNDDLARRMAHSESRAMIVSAGIHFPFRIFDLPGIRRKTVVSVLSWASKMSWPGLRIVLSDRSEGARLVAEHLYSRGHRHVLVLGTLEQLSLLEKDSPMDMAPSWPFRREWERLGCRWSSQRSIPRQPETYMRLDEKEFLGVFERKNPPTAVFGLRDYEAWLAQDLLLRRCPGLAGKIEIIGYGNTPWSEAGHPPFTTVDYNLDEIVGETMKVLNSSGDTGASGSGMVASVKPKLMIRSGSDS